MHVTRELWSDLEARQAIFPQHSAPKSIVEVNCQCLFPRHDQWSQKSRQIEGKGDLPGRAEGLSRHKIQAYSFVTPSLSSRRGREVNDIDTAVLGRQLVQFLVYRP